MNITNQLKNILLNVRHYSDDDEHADEIYMSALEIARLLSIDTRELLNSVLDETVDE